MAEEKRPSLSERDRGVPRGRRNHKSPMPTWASRHTYPQFIQIPNDILLSPAFCSLTANAKMLYIYMRMWAVKANQDSRFCFPFFLVTEHQPQIMSQRTFYRARDELIKAGFIEQTNAHKTARNTSERERTAEYAFSGKWKKTT